LTATITRMMAASSHSFPPLARDSPAAPSSTRIMGSRICSKSRPRSPACGGGSSSLGPVRRRRSSAWCWDSPPGRASNSSKSRGSGLLCQLLISSHSFHVLPLYQRACPLFGEIREGAPEKCPSPAAECFPIHPQGRGLPLPPGFRMVSIHAEGFAPWASFFPSDGKETKGSPGEGSDGRPRP